MTGRGCRVAPVGPRVPSLPCPSCPPLGWAPPQWGALVRPPCAGQARSVAIRRSRRSAPQTRVSHPAQRPCHYRYRRRRDQPVRDPADASLNTTPERLIGLATTGPTSMPIGRRVAEVATPHEALGGWGSLPECLSQLAVWEDRLEPHDWLWDRRSWLLASGSSKGPTHRERAEQPPPVRRRRSRSRTAAMRHRQSGAAASRGRRRAHERPQRSWEQACRLAPSAGSSVIARGRKERSRSS